MANIFRKKVMVDTGSLYFLSHAIYASPNMLFITTADLTWALMWVSMGIYHE